ncbi:MAG: protein-L-isoaspartate(D-aspartate) O-methyltransferase [bacterium]
MREQERKDLVDLLRRKGITDVNVLDAFLNVERHLFVPDIMQHHAYKDVALPIGYEQTISQPYTVAFMSQALNLKKGVKVLEIGTGSGYQAALLVYLGMKVYSIERNDKLYQRTIKLFDELGIRAALRCSDGTIGWEEFSPYDGIIVTAGSPNIPVSLKKQLAINGRLVIPVGDKTSQSLKILTKIKEGEFKLDEVKQFAFVPLIGREGWKE